VESQGILQLSEGIVRKLIKSHGSVREKTCLKGKLFIADFMFGAVPVISSIVRVKYDVADFTLGSRATKSLGNVELPSFLSGHSNR